MIFQKFVLSFFSFFIVPQFFTHYWLQSYPAYLKLASGLAISLTALWYIFVIDYFIVFPKEYIFIFSCIILVIFFIYALYKRKSSCKFNVYVWLIAIILLLPLAQHIGTGFTMGDAVVSWNRWAIELFEGTYEPMNAGYPILYPGIWNLFYKAQGTSDIWWTSHLIMFVTPYLLTVILLKLYFHQKDSAFLFVLLALLPILNIQFSISGYMDIPVMILGLINLILIYQADKNLNSRFYSNHIYVALIFGGLAFGTKQAGISFLLFTLIYILYNRSRIDFGYKFYLSLFLSLGIYISFLFIYYLDFDYSVIGNFSELHRIAKLGDTFNIITNLITNSKYKYVFVFLFLISFSFFLSVLYFIYKYKSLNFFQTLCLFFTILGSVFWVMFLSYDLRNLIWVYAFGVIMASAILSMLFQKIPITSIQNRININCPKFRVKTFNLLVISFLVLISSSFTIDNIKVFELQYKNASSIGGLELVNKINELTESSQPCTSLYVLYGAMQYNPAIKDSEKVKTHDFTPNVFDHNCATGIYIVTYKDHQHLLQKYIENGQLVNVDYLNNFYINLIPLSKL
jgi:hypothetical protein